MQTDIKPIEALITLLSRGVFDYTDETKCQHQIAAHLVACGVTFHKEFSLEGGIIDFYFPKSGIGLEVKALKNWSKREVYKQCARYCQDTRVHGLVLATGRAQGLPAQIHGKPVHVYPLSHTLL